jgi:hypothetical protein
MLRVDRLDQREPLRQRSWRSKQDHDEKLRSADPKMPAALRGRAADNWRRLLAIADAAGDDWSLIARRASETLNASRNEQTFGVTILEDIAALSPE